MSLRSNGERQIRGGDGAEAREMEEVRRTLFVVCVISFCSLPFCDFALLHLSLQCISRTRFSCAVGEPKQNSDKLGNKA